MAIFTLGYRGRKPADLVGIIDAVKAPVLWDCRAKPDMPNAFSRMNLKKLLGARYLWTGDMLGGRGKTTPAGLQVLTHAGTSPNLVLMCACASPGECHLYHDVASKLERPLFHIFEDAILSSKELARVMTLAEDDEDFENMPLSGVAALLAAS